MNNNRTEWVMHIWGKKRDTLELNNVEKFHIDMLKFLQPQQKKFDKILINIALDDVNDMNLFNFLKNEVSKVLVNDNVEFKYCQNDSNMGEYVTFRPYVFDRIGEDVDVFYSHFKGYKTFINIFKESFPTRIVDLCEMFWSYIMYRYSLNMKDVEKNLKDKCVYAWFIQKKAPEDKAAQFYNLYQTNLKKENTELSSAVADDMCKHSPGSFLWYNLSNIGKCLEDKPVVRSIDTDYLVRNSVKGVANLCTHFCELYLIQFLNDDVCYSVKDYNDEIRKLKNTLYTQIYPLKKIGKEYIKDFEKYLIEKELI